MASHVLPPLVLGPDPLAEVRPQPPHLPHRERVRQPENLLLQRDSTNALRLHCSLNGRQFHFVSDSSLTVVSCQLSDNSDTFVGLAGTYWGLQNS